MVDDDPVQRRVAVGALTASGADPLEAEDAVQARAALGQDSVDLVVLDINLPGRENGLQLLDWIRREGDLPVILLTASAAESSRVVGLQMGADDYVVKPFSPTELAARVMAVLRRSGRPRGMGDLQIKVGRLSIDEARQEALVEELPVRLTRREFELLSYLARRSSHVVSHQELIDAIWDGRAEASNSLTEHVRRVRRALADTSTAAPTISSVRGVGYILEP